MFLGHIAVGLAGRRVAPAASLAAWIAAVQLVDLIWPILLLLRIEHVRIAPGITAFTPLDFYDYPITHSLVGGLGWAALFSGLWYWRRRAAGTALLLAAGVFSHWLLDVISHRPDMPVLPHGPYVGLGLWYSIAATLVVELTMFAAAILYIWRSRAPLTRRTSFWLLMVFFVIAYFGASFGPPPPNVGIVALSALAMWLLIPWAKWADRRPASSAPRT